MPPVKSEAVTRFQRLFRGRENIHGKTLLDKDGSKKNSWVVYSGPTKSDWAGHLSGKGPGLGIGASTEDNLCYFAAVDVDDHDIDHASLAQLIELSKLPLVVCRSKSGGAHLYLFLKDPARARIVTQKLKSWVQALGLKNAPQKVKGKDKMVVRPIEIFPKNDRLKPDEPGNWINLPYYQAAKTVRYAVNSSGDHLSLEEFLDLAEETSVSALALEGIEPEGGMFSDGPPCLEALHAIGYPEGSRNMGMLNVGIYFKLKYPDEWQDKMVDYNQDKMDPPLKDRELNAIISSLSKRDYFYTKDELPLEPHCNEPVCKKRKYGTNAFRRQKAERNMPQLQDLRKVQTDPPAWILSVDGQDIVMTTEDLMLVSRFRRAVMDSCSRIFPLMKQGDWDEILTELLQAHTVIEAPEDAGISGQFHHLVDEFLLRRVNAQSREDLLAGLPVEEGPRTYFRSSDLLSFLDRKKFKEYSPSKVFTSLRSMGAGHDKFNINSVGVQVWFLPTPQEKRQEFSPKTNDDPEF